MHKGISHNKKQEICRLYFGPLRSEDGPIRTYFGHSVDWAGAKLIYNSENTYNRLVVESALIKHLPNFNSSTGLCAIDNFSKNLILNSDPNISKHLTSLQ